MSKDERTNIRKVIDALVKTDGITRRGAWNEIKRVCKQHKLDRIPTNVQILNECTADERERLKKILMTKPARTSSGVATITVVPAPSKCPGKCIYCPRGEDSPQSYTGTEPAIMRARHNNYDPYEQVRNRIEQYTLMGHPTDKIQIIILGGTFLSLERGYKENFVKRIFDALNSVDSPDLEQSKRLNETSNHRCTGIIIETRPDFCKKDHIDEMLEYGATMVEIGVQSIYPDTLNSIHRMHTLEDVIEATELSKNAGLKVGYHMMPGLPGIGFEADIAQFKELFENESFKPDALKIYPTLVIKGTELYDMWVKGSYVPLDTMSSVELLVESLRHVPVYCRIVRMQRTVSANEIDAGVDKNNLRELVERCAIKRNVRIREIRYREIGRKKTIGFENLRLVRTDYAASNGEEVFLSIENVQQDALLGFIRMRIPRRSTRGEINEGSSIIRELHVYGPLVQIGHSDSDAIQHRGIGKQLLSEAERISKEEFGKTKMVVISGVGVREYYRKRGYVKDGLYMSKKLV